MKKNKLLVPCACVAKEGVTGIVIVDSLVAKILDADATRLTIDKVIWACPKCHLRNT